MVRKPNSENHKYQFLFIAAHSDLDIIIIHKSRIIILNYKLCIRHEQGNIYLTRIIIFIYRRWFPFFLLSLFFLSLSLWFRASVLNISWKLIKAIANNVYLKSLSCTINPSGVIIWFTSYSVDQLCTIKVNDTDIRLHHVYIVGILL